jgi:hypothetical protein
MELWHVRVDALRHVELLPRCSLLRTWPFTLKIMLLVGLLESLLGSVDVGREQGFEEPMHDLIINRIRRQKLAHRIARRNLSQSVQM